MLAPRARSTAARAAPPAKEPAGNVKAVMELRQQFYYVGEPMSVRITISNGGESEVANPVKGPLFTSFAVADAQGKRHCAAGETGRRKSRRVQANWLPTSSTARP